MRLAPSLALVLALAGFARSADDPIAAKLDAARDAYRTATTANRDRLLELLKKEEDAAKKDSDLPRLKRVIAETEAFREKGELPKSVALNEYYAAETRATDAMKAALAEAKAAYIKAGKVAEAEAIDGETERLFPKKPKPEVSPKPEKKEPEPTVVATWAHQVGRGPDAARKTFKCYSNGKINHPEGRATWAIKNGLITFTWPDPKAPGGAWTDVCTLAKDGKSYLGKNQNGTPILGKKLSDGDIDDEPKKKK